MSATTCEQSPHLRATEAALFTAEELKAPLNLSFKLSGHLSPHCRRRWVD